MEISELKWSQFASLNFGVLEVHGLEVMDRWARISDSSFDFQIDAKASLTTRRAMGRRRSKDHATVSVLCFQFILGSGWEPFTSVGKQMVCCRLGLAD